MSTEGKERTKGNFRRTKRFLEEFERNDEKSAT